MSGIGHNGGPSLAPGFGFRKLAWKKARRDLLPSLPLEVVRLRVGRAKRLGLPYKTYATIRATTGHDIVGFLFSGNALDLRPLRPACSADVTLRLHGLQGAAARLAAVYAPTAPTTVLQANAGVLEAATVAPPFTESWSATRARLVRLIRDAGLALDGVVLVPATAVERDWCGAAGLAGLIPADVFFAPKP